MKVDNYLRVYYATFSFSFYFIQLIHIYVARPEVWNTFHDPQEAPVHWIKELSWETIKAIQIECKTAMTLWGYKIMNSKHDVDTILAKTL